MSKHATSRDGGAVENRAAALTVDDKALLADDGTDWVRVLAMSDEEALRNALSDPESLPLPPDQLARMRRAPNPRVICRRLGFTQDEFARRFQIAVGTLRDWEQGVHVPDSAATAYLRVIAQDPEGVARALAASIPEPAAPR
jgi:putative transcriptional regulator